MYRYILDEHREPKLEEDFMEWSKWFTENDPRVVQDLDEGLTGPEDSHRVLVSTIFLGIDYSFGLGSKPLLWETMVLGGLLGGEQRRYTSEEDAYIGHQEMCQRVNETIQRR